MSKGIKFSKSVSEGSSEQTQLKRTFAPHLLYANGMAYLIGAGEQVNRYREASKELTVNAVMGVYKCLHEISNLFEDLVTVSKYIEMSGVNHQKHQLWLDVRNHIRHDVREEYDNETNKRKNDRAKRLKINEKLQTEITFDTTSFSVGGTVITLDEINEYIQWASKIFDDVMVEAMKKGLIKNEPSPSK